jgi:hypothetical protein
MKVIKAKIRESEILVGTIDDDIDLPESNGRATQTTSIPDRINTCWDTAKELITTISEDVGSAIISASNKTQPCQVEMELSIGFSAKTGMWVLTGKGNCGFKVKLVWELA